MNRQLNDIIAETLPYLEQQSIAQNILRFGGHIHRVNINNEPVDFWSEFVRITDASKGTLVFRVITRIKENSPDDKKIVQGIRALPLHETHQMLLDHRSNLEREISPGFGKESENQETALRNAYTQLLSHKIDIVITPVREGSLGPTEKIGPLEPFTQTEIKDKPTVWDIEEEIKVARAFQKAFSGEGLTNIITALRSEIAAHYTIFAQPLAQLLNATMNLLEMTEISTSLSDKDVDLQFFDDQEKSRLVAMGDGMHKVDQVIAYLYPTEKGVLYARLLRVWNTENTEFEVVRVLQTQPQLEQIDGLRIDSSCVDGVHSLDCHCDCKDQLNQALNAHGLEKNQNVVVLQLADHEGKGWGTVLKGAGQHQLVREFNRHSPESPINHVIAANRFNETLGVPPDNRKYDAAQAAVMFLEITHVDNLLMDNCDKVAALKAANVTYKQKVPLYPEDPTKLSVEARRVIEAKHSGLVKNQWGDTVVYDSVPFMPTRESIPFALR